VIDDAVDQEQTTGVRARSWRKVVGHVEAEVGPENDGTAPTRSVRATFAANVIER
jgi:hypothetical protein